MGDTFISEEAIRTKIWLIIWLALWLIEYFNRYDLIYWIVYMFLSIFAFPLTALLVVIKLIRVDRILSHPNYSNHNLNLQ